MKDNTFIALLNGYNFKAKPLSFWCFQTFSQNSRGKKLHNSIKKLKFRQIHLVYLPKIGGIKKLVLKAIKYRSMCDIPLQATQPFKQLGRPSNTQRKYKTQYNGLEQVEPLSQSHECNGIVFFVYY